MKKWLWIAAGLGVAALLVRNKVTQNVTVLVSPADQGGVWDDGDAGYWEPEEKPTLH